MARAENFCHTMATSAHYWYDGNFSSSSRMPLLRGQPLGFCRFPDVDDATSRECLSAERELYAFRRQATCYALDAIELLLAAAR